MTSLGASHVFDYNSPTVVADITAALQGRTLAGAVAVGTTSAAACVRILGACQGNRSVAIATPPVSFARLLDEDRSRYEPARVLARLVTSNVTLQVRARLRRVRARYIFGTTLKANEVSTAIYRDFLPAALADGRYVAAPSPVVVGTGVQDIQHALDAQRGGVSATKVVVALP